MGIRLLSPDISSKIAAGEVVERPSSIVKELVENSLDAGATEVSVEVRGGGAEYLRVSDNGVGIAEDEVELAFQRFATSKVAEAPDLDAISTLGFRGEALPSIAAVSTVSLVTRTATEEYGTRVDIADGRLVNRQRVGAAPGTAVTVRHLFRGFPARRKFLRSPSTETARVQSVAIRYAMAYPHVRFQVAPEGSVVFSTSGSGDLREVVSEAYGRDLGGAMLALVPSEVSDEEPFPAASGLIGPPSVDRANRDRISIFVNARWVQSRMLAYALQEAYRGFLKERRYPVAVVNIAMPFESVDVNVHPAKTDVRFRREGPVFTALQQAVRRTLTEHSPVPEIGGRAVPGVAHAAPTRRDFAWPPYPKAQTAHQPVSGAPPHGASAEVPQTAEVSQPLVPHAALPALRVLGQVQQTYIVSEGPDGVYLIDQHAAHERVLFERVRAEALSRSAQSQSLLEPATLELDPRQAELVETHADLISSSGFHLEAFGGRTYILRAVPGLLSGEDPAKTFVDVLDLMSEGGDFESFEERAAYSIACHGAIRAGKTLTQEEMAELTRQLESCQQPHTCPHGRPTMIHMSSARLEREFGRA